MEDIDDIWKSVTSASVCDALGRICNHRAHVLDLVSPTPGKVLFGPAVTLRMLPLRDDLFDENVNSFSCLFYEAVGATPKGKVLVLDSSGHSDVSVGGGTKLSRLHNLELAGMITDGRLRDFEELATYEPVFYCRGTTLRAGTGDLMPVAANEPVNLAGATVVPGDYIFADGAGTVILPAGLAHQALKAAQEVQAQDSYYLDVIRREVPASDRGSASDNA